MSRLPRLDQSRLEGEQRLVADEIRNGPRGRLSSLFEVWLRHPALCDRIRRLGDYARWETSLPRDLAELAILGASAHFEAWPEFEAHARFAREAGISDATIDALRAHQLPALEDARQAVTCELVAEYFATHRVTAATYAKALDLLGEGDLVDVVALAGYYAMVCMTVNVFEITG